MKNKALTEENLSAVTGGMINLFYMSEEEQKILDSIENKDDREKKKQEFVEQHIKDYKQRPKNKPPFFPRPLR